VGANKRDHTLEIDIYRFYGVQGVKNLSSVSIGDIAVPASAVEQTIAPYCRQLIVHTHVEAFPYQLYGSATLIKYKNRHFALCTGHQADQFQPDDISIYIPSTEVIISASRLFIPDNKDFADDSDNFDVRIFEFETSNYTIPNLNYRFFPVRPQDRWKPESEIRLLAFGFPSILQDVDYEFPRISASVVCATALYDGRTNAAFLHRLRMDREETVSSDGMSGGGVYFLGGSSGPFRIGFAGLILRGSDTSNYLHFLDSNRIIEYLEKLP
jgi:hypothetical protein